MNSLLKRLLPESFWPLLMPAAGALSTFSFAPWSWWPLQIASLALLFAAVLQAPDRKNAALYGWLLKRSA